MKRHIVALISFFIITTASAGEGLVTKQSGFGAGATLDRLEAVLQKKGITIFARVSHTGGAEGVGCAASGGSESSLGMMRPSHTSAAKSSSNPTTVVRPRRRSTFTSLQVSNRAQYTRRVAAHARDVLCGRH